MNNEGTSAATSGWPLGWPSDSDWSPRLAEWFASPEFETLAEFLVNERQAGRIFPPIEEVYTAFRLTSFADTKVVILGQDPYHGEGQAHGLSFSVQGEIKLPPSLRNIYKELAMDLGGAPPAGGNLTPWAEQGVFLLNTVLTVREGEANSHRKQGWELFTDEVIRQLSSHPTGIVFVLWGKPAEKKLDLIDQARHRTIVSPHPSPLSASRGFFGSRPFSRINEALRELGRSPIQWSR